MKNDIVVQAENSDDYKPLTSEEKDGILDHLKRGGSPVTTHQVTGIGKDRLMGEFRNNMEFAKECTIARSRAMADLEYSIYDMAKCGPPREAIKALEILLKSNIPELYNASNSKIEEKMKKMLKDK